MPLDLIWWPPHSVQVVSPLLHGLSPGPMPQTDVCPVNIDFDRAAQTFHPAVVVIVVAVADTVAMAASGEGFEFLSSQEHRLELHCPQRVCAQSRLAPTVRVG